MYQRIQILNSKLFIPRLSETVKRGRLHPLLSKITKKALTTVIAGAGYGKTTLLVEAVNISGMDTIWYRLDKSDRDFITFMSYLIAGIQKYYPGMGTETLPRIEEAQNFSKERESFLAVFINEIEKVINKDIIIVLDDYHLIQDNNEINQSLGFLLEHFPSLIHLVIIGRSDPNLQLSLLRARREVLDIREKDLIFSASEIKELFLQVFDISLEDQSLQSLRQKTDGWVSGLVLFYHSLRGKSSGDISEQLLKLKGSHGIISDYLEENVYNLLQDDLRNFLIKTSILSRINVDFCNQFLGIDNSINILMYIEENHLFTFPFDDTREWYYYHNLFREILNKKLTIELDREAILNLHKHAASLWENRGEDEEALRHYLLAEQLEKAWTLFRKLGMRMLQEGRIHLINSYLKIIPDSYKDNEPWIQYIQALTLELSGRPQMAIRAYNKAHKTFREHESLNGVVLTLNSLSFNYFIDGDFPRAERKLKELLNQVGDNPRFCIDVLTNLMHLSYHQGKLDDGDKYFQEAMSLLSGLENKELLVELYINNGFRHVFSGDATKALTLGEQAKELCENLGLYDWLVLDFSLLSLSCYMLGLFSEGIEYTRKGIDLVKERGLDDGLTAIHLMIMALNAAELGKTTEAIDCGTKSLKIFQNKESRWTQAWAYYVLHRAHLKSVNHKAAEECAKSGIELIDNLTLPMEDGVLKHGLAESLIERGQWDDARILLDGAEKLLKNSKLFMSRVNLMYARLYWEQNQKKPALGKLLAGLQLSEANHYDIWVTSEKRWIIPLLVEIFARDKMKVYLLKLLKEMGLSARKELILLQKSNNSQTKEAACTILNEIQKSPLPGLRVYCFGKFRVFQGDEEIPAEKWKSKKAKMLFKFLLYVRSRDYLSKEVLMEMLWPEENPKRTTHRLQVALSSLRKILEPNISTGESSSYLLREGSSYKLNLGYEGWLDVDEFKLESELARDEKNPDNAISHLLKAESLYRGDYLEEDLYVEWCFDERDRLKEEYMNLLEKIIEYFEKNKDYLKCIEYSKKYLEIDKYAEKIYQHLMKYYSLTGNKDMVIRTFEKCKKNIKKELDTPLSEETEALYHQLAST